MTRTLTAFILIAVAACFGADATLRADSAPSASPTAAKPAPSATETPAPGPTPIPLAEVATQAESVSVMLRNIQSDLASDQITPLVERDLPGITRDVEAQSDVCSKILLPSPSLETLRGVEAGWQKLGQNLSLWTRDLTERATRLDKQVVSLAQLGATWDQTLKLAQSSAAPREVIQRIQALITTIKQTRTGVEKQRAKILSLQNKVAGQDARVAEGFGAVKTAYARAVDRLFSTDSPPIWSVEMGLGTGQGLVQEGKTSVSTQVAALQAYARLQSQNFLLHGILFFVLLGALYWARRRVQPWAEEEPGAERTARIFELPVATAIVLSLLIGGWIYAQAPRLLWAIWGAASLIPTILILRRLVERRLFPILNALVVLYFIDQIRDVAASLPVLSRLLFLAEMLGGILFTVWLGISMRSTSEGGKPQPTGLSVTIRIGARIALVGFSAAFLLNALGYVALSTLLGDAALKSAYLAVILYAVTRIGDGLIMGALSIPFLAQFGMVRRHRPLIWHRLRHLLQGGALLLWGFRTLNLLALRAPLTEKAREVLTSSLAIGSLNVSLGNLFGFGLCVWGAFLLSRLLRFILEEDVYPRVHLSRGLPYAISTMMHYVILLVGFFVATAALGIDMTKFAILAGAFGVGLGFGLQNIINNFVSGLILLFERPVKVGDVVQMENASGVVDRIGIRASIIRTAHGSEIIVPNGKLISDSVTNWTLSNRQRGTEIPVGVAYGTDPCRVLELLKKVAIAHPLVTENPPPKPFFVKFGTDALEFELHFWTDHYEECGQIRSDLAVAINAMLLNENIAIPYAQHDLHLRSIAPELMGLVGGKRGDPSESNEPDLIKTPTV